MKKLTLGALAILFIATADAQFNTGDRYLTGYVDAGAGTQKINTTKTKTYGLTLAPAISKFKTPNKANGFKILLGFQHSKSDDAFNVSTGDQYSVSAGMFSQRYFTIGKNFYLMLEKGIDAGYTYLRSRSPSAPNYKSDRHGYGIGVYLTPGMGYKLTDRLIIGLNFSNLARLGYSFYKYEVANLVGTTTSESSQFNFSSSVNNTSVGNLGITFGWKLK
jgi:hypothetical protein